MYKQFGCKCCNKLIQLCEFMLDRKAGLHLKHASILLRYALTNRQGLFLRYFLPLTTFSITENQPALHKKYKLSKPSNQIFSFQLTQIILCPGVNHKSVRGGGGYFWSVKSHSFLLKRMINTILFIGKWLLFTIYNSSLSTRKKLGLVKIALEENHQFLFYILLNN